MNMIDVCLQRHEQFLKQVLQNTPIPAPIIREAIHYALFPGGKRIRPIFVYLTGELLRINTSILDVIAAAIELTHCYSLIHDDLPAMDNDDMRRGKLSCHKAYDEATAILAGDGMQTLAIELLLTHLSAYLNASQVIAITQILLQASGIGGMVSGQSLDLSELSKTSVHEQQLKDIHLLKTGKLISACFEMVLAAQTTREQRQEQALMCYAQHIGLVFQMQDDYLDCYAPVAVLGKSHSSDLNNQKTTFASLLSRSQLEQEIATHYQQAIAALDTLDNDARPLIELSQKLHQRSLLDDK
jgi:farnesyl diphosphate synthase